MSIDLFETPEVYYNVSLVHTKKGNTEEAAASVKKSLELDPDYAEAWDQLGNLYLDQNDLQGAAKHYEKAVELNPGYAFFLGINQPDVIKITLSNQVISPFLFL